MAELIKVNKKVINDPLYTPVVKFLKERIAYLEENGPQSELELARERYTGIVAGDLVIENPVAFSDGAIRVCFVSRKTGFARVDVDITRVQMSEILDDFQIPLVVINDPDHLKAWVKSNPVESALLWLEDRQTYGVILTQEAARTHAGPMSAFGDLFFEEYTTTRESLTSIDYETLESGTLTVKDVSFGEETYPLFIYELVLEEANLPEITSNLPATLTTRRGETFSIPNTYWFAGTQDITLEITLSLSTNSGYVIPTRSNDLLFLNGDTIFGSATENVEDTITVRATYMWNGRPVRKTFRIGTTIEKDEVSDLTLVPVPETIQATTGDTLEVVISAFFTETPVTILVPPTEIVSSRNYGKLSYVNTRPDGGMVYRGTITGSLPSGKETDTDLFTGQFLYNGDDGTPYWGTGYVNIVVVKPEVQPKFEVKKFTSAVSGYKGATGVIDVEVTYGDVEIPVSQLGITTGVKGTKGLIEYKSLDTNKVNYELIADSGVPGQITTDAFTQFLIYVDDKGIRHVAQPVFNVTVKKASVVEIVPVAPQPRNVKRYQYGGPTFQVLVNGEDKTDTITNLRNKNPEDTYIVFPGDFVNRWQVLNTKTTSYTHSMVFMFDLAIDGEAAKPYEFPQQFVIEPWTKTEGPNSSIVIAPDTASITGDSDQSGSFTFKVFEGANDITANAKIVEDRTVVPEKVTFTSITYDATKRVFVVNYFKNSGVVSTGQIYVAKKTVENPTDNDVGLIDISVNVNQIKILKLIGTIPTTDITVEQTADVDINIEFSGTRLALNDPNLTISKLFISETGIKTFNQDTVTLECPNWKFVGRSYNESGVYRVDYRDPADGKTYTIARIDLPVTITYPPMRVVQTTDTIDAKIWDKNVFPLKLMAGDHDFTNAIYSTELITANKYVAINGLNWNVYFAESTATSTIVGIRMRWSVGETTNQSNSTDFKFNLAAWDGITFAVTELVPEGTLTLASGQAGEISVKLVYKGNDATQTAILDLANSDIPRTFTLGSPYYDNARGLVIPYTSKLGGTYDLKLKFKAPSPGTETLTVTIPTEVQWPNDLNIDSAESRISGFWQDQLDFMLIVNFNGVALPLNDPSLNVGFNSGTDVPISLVEIKEQALTVSLDKGGVVGNVYNYEVDINLEYLNPLDGQTYSKALVIPAFIRISDVTIGTNPTESVKVYDRGVIKTTLVDERGQDVPITSYAPRGTNNYVAFVSPKNWYVTAGNLSNAVNTKFPITIGYDMGGASYTKDVDIDFNIAAFDGIKFKGTTTTRELKGKAGDNGTIQFDFTYLGDPITGVTLDTTNSIIPLNLAIGDLSPTGELPYTLVGQAVDTVKLVFLRPNGAVPPVNNVDSVTITMGVTSTSSDEEFSLTTYDTAISLDWGKTGTLNVSPRYGLYDLAANAPGLRYTLTDEASKSVSIVGTTKTGVMVKAIRSNVPGSVDVRPEDILVTYDVGAPTPKTAHMSFNATITMGNASIGSNPVVPRNIWDLGTFGQQVLFNGVVLNTVDHYEVRTVNKYVEMVSAKGYEIIGAELTTSTQTIPMRAYYKVDETDTLQTIDFDAQFQITGSSSGRFTVTATPNKIEGTVNNDVTIAYRPIYKDKLVGAAATFKQELCTLPPQVVIKSHTVSGSDHLITFTGKAGGIANAKIVFWSPNAGDTPPAREVWEGQIEARILDGDLGLEVGTRDNLLTGKSGDTGTYRLQLLFGALPIDISDEISRGNLTIAVEVGAAASANANVLSATAWHADTFDFSLFGPVSPGKTVSVSDFINVTYRFGGQTYTRRVEIPMSYTSSKGSANVVNYAGKAIWNTGTLSNPTITCDGVTLPAFASATDTTDPAQNYVKITGKTYEITNADTVATNQTVKLKYVGIYRNWTYEVEANTTWSIAGWNGYTFEPGFTTSWTGYLGMTQTLYLTVKNKGVTFTPTPGYDYIDRTLTDFKGLFTLEFTGNTSFSGGSYAVYKLTPLKYGKDTVRIAFRMYNSPVPGVEKVDYTYVDFAFECKEKVLTVTGGPISGGNGDVVNAPLSISVTAASGTGTTGILTNSTDLTITLANEDHFKITGKTTNALTVQITEPLGNYTGAVTTDITVVYNDPVTHVPVTKVYTYTLNRIKPKDYPVLGLTAPVENGGKRTTLWAYGPSWITATVSGVDVTAGVQVVSISDPGNWVILSKDQPVPGTVWWCINGPGSFAGSQNTTWVVDVPFRGGYERISTTFNLWMGSGDGSSPFAISTLGTQRFSGNVGDTYEVPVKITWRGYKYGQAVFNPGASLAATGVPFTNYFDFISQRYDDTTGTTYITIKVTKEISSQTTLTFDMPDAGSNPVIGKTRAQVFMVASWLKFVDVTNPSVFNMWDSKRLNTMFNLQDAGTNITTQLTLLSVSEPLLVITQASHASASPSVQMQSYDENAGWTRDVTFTVQLGADYQNRTLTYTQKVTLNPYNGIVFTQQNAGPLNPKTPYTLGNGITALLYFKGSSTNQPSQVKVDKTKFEAMNPDLLWASQGLTSGSNWFQFGYTAKRQVYKKVIIPIDYIGPGYDVWPVGTLGKNYIEVEQNVNLYEEKMYWYPDNVPPVQVSGSYNENIAIPVPLTMGLNIDVNNLPGTSRTSMTLSVISGGAGLVTPSNDATGPITADSARLRILYDNRGADTVVTVRLRLAISTYNNRTVNTYIDWDQEILIKGTNVGDTTVAINKINPTVDVWQVGSLPFQIQHNGATISTANYKSTAVTQNAYVRTPETNPTVQTRTWEIYAGTVAGNTVTTEFTVVFNDGVKDVTFTTTVNFTIRPYDGLEFKMSLYIPATFNNGMCTTPTAQGSFNITGSYRGVQIQSAEYGVKYGMWTKGVNLPGHTLKTIAATGSGSNPYYQVITATADANDMPVSLDGEILFGLLSKQNDPNAVENVDFVRVKVPCYVYIVDKWYVVSQPASLSGKFGDPYVATPFTVRKGLVQRSLVYGSNPTVENAGNLVLQLGSSDSATKVTWKFNAELTTAPQQTLQTVFTFGEADTTKRARATVPVTQISNYPFPTVSDLHTVTANLNESGGIPFTLKDDTDTDITSTATITGVAANSYIDFVNGKWHVYNARAGDTTVTVTLTYSLTYKGNALVMKQDVEFLVKGFTDQPTVSNVTEVTGNVWDSGSELPFTININGSPVPASWITASSGVSPNSRVTVGPGGKQWKIVDGDLTQAVRETVTYSVTVTNGTLTWTVTQDVVFNINKYDGVEFKLILGSQDAAHTPVTEGIYFIPANTTQQGLYILPWYRGDIGTININQQSAGSVGSGLSALSLQNTGSLLFYKVTSAAGLQQMSTITINGRRSLATGNEVNKDIATIVIPTCIYKDTSYLVASQTTAVTGKLGSVMDVQAKILTPPNFVDLTNPVHTFTFTPSNVIELVPGSVTARGFKVRFIADVDATTVTDVTVKPTNGSLSADVVLSVTQDPTRVPISGSGTVPVMKLGDTNKIHITGSYGSQGLAGNVTFDPANSDAKGLYTFGAMTPNLDGSIDIAVTAIAVGSDTVSVRLKAIDHEGTEEGKDILTLNVAADVVPTQMDQPEDFATTVDGNSGNTVTVTQYMTLPN